MCEKSGWANAPQLAAGRREFCLEFGECGLFHDRDAPLPVWRTDCRGERHARRNAAKRLDLVEEGGVEFLLRKTRCLGFWQGNGLRKNRFGGYCDERRAASGAFDGGERLCQTCCRVPPAIRRVERRLMAGKRNQGVECVELAQ